MRLDFNILWIEDQPGAVGSIADRLQLHMDAEGFKLVPQFVGSVEEAKQCVTDHVFSDNIDLVLVDYELGQGPHGDVALSEVRKELEFKEIVFYSARPAANLKKLAFEQNVEGVYCAFRGDLVDTVQGVFETLVKKVLDIDHSRGIVMGATSDIDHVVQDCLQGIQSTLDAAGQKKLLDSAQTKIDEKLERIVEKADALKANFTMQNLLDYKHNDLFTAVDKLRFLRNGLNEDASKKHAEARKMIGLYAGNVLPRRNKLGHVRLVAEGATRSLLGRGGEEVTLNQMRELRRDLIKHRDNFDQLAKSLGGKVD